MAVWEINIEEGDNPGDPAKFVPAIEQPGADGLLAATNDGVSWSNRTDDVHQPWPTDENFTPLPDALVLPRGSPNYLSDPIEPNHPSRPTWIVQKLAFPPAPPPPPPVGDGTTIFYCCKLHPEMHGKIIITA